MSSGTRFVSLIGARVLNQRPLRFSLISRKYLHCSKVLSFETTSAMETNTATGGSEGGHLDPLRFLNEQSLKRQPSLLREMTKMGAAASPDLIFLAGGHPNPQLFPFRTVDVQLDGDSDDPSNRITISGRELQAALQYQPTSGFPPLQSELKKLASLHFPPPLTWENTELITTVGSQNGLCSVLEMVLNPGDPILIPEPCYSSALTIMDPLSPTYLAIPEDDNGLRPDLLVAELEKYYKNQSSSDFRRPKILYVNPTGGNPSGIVIPTQRKKEIYRIAQQYDLLLLEDDPYYFLHFLQEDPTSFLSLDVDGRVIRFDSFSKILSSGFRVGFATGPKQLIRALELRLQASILHTSSLSQVFVHGVLMNWGSDGFRRHIDRVKCFYQKRRDLMIAAVEKHLTGLAEWSVPKGGMFLWLKLIGIDDTYDMLMKRGLEKKILALPGRECMAKREDPCSYVRLSYSVVPEDRIEEGIIRFAELVKEERARKPI